LISILQNSLNETLAALPANAMAELGSLIDPVWIEQALHASGKASIRRRKLPADHAIWLVIGFPRARLRAPNRQRRIGPGNGLLG